MIRVPENRPRGSPRAKQPWIPALAMMAVVVRLVMLFAALSTSGSR